MNIMNEIFAEKEVTEEKIDLYEEKMNEKSIVEMKFDSIDIDGNLYLYDDDIRVQLDDHDINLSYKRARHRVSALDIPYMAMVTSVERSDKVVHVSHSKIKEIIKKELIRNINDSVDKNNPLTIMAKVTKIKGEPGSNHTMIDIGNLGILGVIKMKDWGIAFTDNLRLETRYGDFIKVKVIKQIRWDGNKAYSCSRKAALDENPWNDIETRVPKQSIVKVTCTSKTIKNFFGKIEGIIGLNAYCEYPGKEKNIDIIVGDTYKGYVCAVNEETKLLRVRIWNKIEMQ